MVKTLQKSSPETAGRFPRNLVCSIGDLCWSLCDAVLLTSVLEMKIVMILGSGVVTLSCKSKTLKPNLDLIDFGPFSNKY